VELIKNKFKDLQEVLNNFEIEASDSINSTANLIAESFRNGNKILICGNGGSASDAQHFAAEFVNSFSKTINRVALPAISLTSDSSVLTSIANDKNFESVFSRQVEAFGKPGDVLVVFTTSGESKNCLKALETAKRLSLKTVSFTQKNKISAKISDMLIEVPSSDTQIIQECHIVAYHIIAELVEKILFTREVSI
jgi:D-sedoheptulose 7-phosphate isomerase